MADSYVYSPMLARLRIVGKVNDFDQALTRCFGDADAYNINALEQVQIRFGARPIIPGQRLRWINVGALGGKIFPTGGTGPLGGLKDNMLSKTPGRAVEPPKGMTLMSDDHDISDLGPCKAKTYLAQCRPQTSAPKDPETGARVGQKTSGRHQALKDLKRDDKLYIVGHCSYRGDYLGYKSPTRTTCGDPNCHKHHISIRYVDPATLAGLLVQEGLPDTFRELYVVGCWTGGLDRKSEQSVQPYAQRLVGALKGWGYDDIVAYGMTGIAHGSSLGATQIDRIQDGKLVFQVKNPRTPFENALRRY